MAQCGGSQPFPCPSSDAVPSANRGQCRANLLACFDGNQTLGRSAVAALSSNCSADQKWCPAVGCVDASVDCVPVEGRCAASTPARCRASMKCTSNLSACDDSLSGSCGTGQVLCIDGITCAANQSACARSMSWNGPGPGKTACAQDPSVFADSQSACASLTGCPDGTKVCGVRLSSSFTPFVNTTTGRPVFLCNATCQSAASDRTVSDFAAASIKVDGASAATLSLVRNGSAVGGSGRVGAAMRLRDHAFTTVDNATKTVNFSFSAVADSARDEGPFKALVQARRLMSPLLTITPSAQIVPGSGGIELEFCIDDDSVRANASACGAMIGSLQVVSVDSIYDSSASPSTVSACSLGTSGQCSCGCAVNVTHFSTYGVSLSGGEDYDTYASGGDASLTSGNGTAANATDAASSTTTASGGATATTSSASSTSAGGGTTTTASSGSTTTTTTASSSGGSGTTTTTTPTPSRAAAGAAPWGAGQALVAAALGAMLAARA